MLEHLVCIMDGNRRWAQRAGLQLFKGHKQGAKTVKTVIDFCLEKEIKQLSLYAFSLENLKRSIQEKQFLFSLFEKEVTVLEEYAQEKEVRIRFVGDDSLFPEQLKSLCNVLEQKTASHTKLYVNILFCYGGKQDIINGIKKVAQKVQEGSLDVNTLDESLFTTYLWSKDIPPPDLIIRTGGHQRLSNCLLFHAAYSELYFLDCLWPDLEYAHLSSALKFYNKSRRNFGK